MHSLSLERRQAEKAYFGQKVVQVTGSWPLFLLPVGSWFLHNSGSCFNAESPREVRSDVSHGLSSLDLSAFLSIQVLWCVPASDLGTLGSAPTGIELLFSGRLLDIRASSCQMSKSFGYLPTYTGTARNCYQAVNGCAALSTCTKDGQG